ncbi:RNA polymerase sigma factor [Arsenicitalea aurantiaca]|uniref:RNA polymerase sigma factor n=1 Tax=Arsenicitalea aurantiaca TaxID=1783274 RepID=A0A433X448_9HYPH|nr:RNA polymerase sigma factor [Arsenicitalea aurantiaca]RUT28839.1 RNA polymerase sigma factor [Arsenicitalea aurantiaca]
MAEDIRYGIVALLPRLRGFAHALAGNRADADDLVQQTCERALRNSASFTPGTRLDSWLYRIMRNLFIDGRRARRPSVSIEDEAVAETLAGEDGRRVSEARIALGQTEALIAALPEEQRSVLVLVCMEGLRYREVAEILDIPIGTVMSRLARARLAVAEGLEGGQSETAGDDRAERTGR